MSEFWQALKESIIIQAVLTIGIWGVILYLVLRQFPVPDLLANSGYAVLGFYFGSKVAMAQFVRSKG